MKSAEIVMPATLVAYFLLLIYISLRVSRKSAGGGNDDFFRAGHSSPWWMVAVGMVGASISGVTFMSVPGWAAATGMTYLQMCLGFIPGYLLVAYVLLPVYYKLRLTSIYTVLADRLGKHSHRTGAAFFVLSKLTGAAARLFPVCLVLDTFVTRPMLRAVGFEFGNTLTLCLTALALLGLMWGYTRRGGIKTLVWTDTFQTLCMFAALLLIIYKVTGQLGMTPTEAIAAISQDEHSRIFVFDDWVSRQNFWKQFLSGIFVVIVMTGLDQDMMQKNLTCKTLREAQKDMCSYGFAFVPANLLFLSLGVLLMMLAKSQGMALPEKPDDLLPMFAASGALGSMVTVFFTIGVVAASFSSADSALTALTTSVCVDIFGRDEDEDLRKKVHLAVAMVFMLFIIGFGALNSTSVIDAIYILCSYTYGPLLGLFAFGLMTHRKVNDRWVPWICIASPLICFAVDTLTMQLTGYKFGYELLMLNGALTFAGLALSGIGQEVKELRS